MQLAIIYPTTKLR